MKLTICTLATADRRGPQAAVFGTRAARDEALPEWVGSGHAEWTASNFSDDLQAFAQSKTHSPDAFSMGAQKIEIAPAQLMSVNEAWAVCKDSPGSFGNLYDPDEIMSILESWADEGDEDESSYWFNPDNTEDRMAILAWCEAEGPDFEDRISGLICTNLPDRREAFAALEARHQDEACHVAEYNGFG